MTRECKTCWRWRPEDEFLTAETQPGVARRLPICRSCREKLWGNPDDRGEINDPDALARAEFRAQRLAAIEPARGT
jgi:hypothetical protein